MKKTTAHQAAAARKRPVVAPLLALAILGLAGCGRAPHFEPPRPAATSILPEPATWATPTARPFPDGLPVSDGRVRPERAPEADALAPCGRVDRLDFPLGPPDSYGYNARWAYGRMSRRYGGKIHAGEDWLAASGSSLGHSVYSVGHGRVEYAEPYGWGQTDKGVVIIRHVFADDSTVLSFYGHLEPSSVQLAAGSCIRRGQQIGLIGKPSGRPHLHFEIRDHMPNTPGPGYWPSDPSQAGWHPPSDFIWQRRLTDSPGLRWTTPITLAGSLAPLRLPGGELLQVQEAGLVALGPQDGQPVWQIELDAPPSQWALDLGGQQLYWSNRGGRLIALRLPEADAIALEPSWSRSIPRAAASSPLIPLPEGGIAFHDGRDLIGLTQAGDLLWRSEGAPVPASFAAGAGRLVYSTAPRPLESPGERVSVGARTFLLDPGSGRTEALSTAWGQPVFVGESLFIRHVAGIYRVDEAMARERGPLAATKLALALDPGALDFDSALALPDASGLLVAHRGRDSARLARLDAQGRLQWERDITPLVSRSRPPKLLLHAGRVIAATERGDLFEIDTRSGSAAWVFDPGWGSRLAGDLQALGSDDGPLLIDYRSGQLVALDPPQPALDLRSD